MDIDRTKKSVIRLSLNPSLVNQNVKRSQLTPCVTVVGAVKSVEDNGYIIDSGIRNISFFLPFDETPLHGSERFSIGSLVEVSVLDDKLSDSTARVVRVSMLKKQKIPKNASLPFDCLLPGMHIPLRIRSSGPEGLLCLFNSFNIHVPTQHCPFEVNHYTLNSQVTGCIVSVDLVTKEISASLLPHFLKDDLAEDHGLLAYKYVKIGHRCDDAVLKRRERNCVYLWLPSLKRCGVLLKGNAFDEKPPKKWTLEIPESTPLKCRVIDFDLFLNLPLISCKRNVLESVYLSVEDVKMGSIFSVSVKKFTKRGVAVRLGGKIRGIIPFFHLSDASIKNPQERFKVGSKVRVMALALNKDDELLLTAKKSLLSSNHTILGSTKMLQAWTKIEESKRTQSEPLLLSAFVLQASSKGVLVCGLNNVRGWIPRGQTFGKNVDLLEKCYARGETVTLRVIKRLNRPLQRVDKPSTEFLLSEILDPSAIVHSAPLSNTPVTLGEVYYCQVVESRKQDLKVCLYKTCKAEGSAIAEATLPFSHISDSPSINQLARCSASACFRPMTMLSTSWNVTGEPKRVVVIDITAVEVVVSAKPSLIIAAEEDGAISKSSGFLYSLDQLKVGTQWLGWVSNHKDYGVMVEFPGGLRGLVPTRYIADRRASADVNWANILPIGSSVEAKVVEISTTPQPRFLLSLRMKDIYKSAAQQYVETAVSQSIRYVEECRWLCSRVENLKPLSQFNLGQIVNFRVEELTENAVLGSVEIPGSTSVPAAALLPNTEGVECALGSVYPSVVTLPNLEAGRLEVALLPWLLSAIQQRIDGQLDSHSLQVRLGQVIDSSVVSMSNGRDIIVVALKQHALGHLVVLPARRCFNDLIGGNAWALGQVNRVTIRNEIPVSANNKIKSFVATLSIYDPVGRPKSNTFASSSTLKSFNPTTSASAVSLEELTTPGSSLPEVVFISLKARTAHFRLPQSSRGSRELRTRLSCRLVDFAPTAKAARQFISDPPPSGTVFHNAVVVSSPPAEALALSDLMEGKSGFRLPLSMRMTRISFVGKEPEVGDLVCAMFLGVSGISWRLLLPRNARGLLHFSCMSNSGLSQFTTHPKNSPWLTCRIVDVLHDQEVMHEAVADVEEDEEVEMNDDNEDVPQIAKGDAFVPITKGSDTPSRSLPIKVFYVSTEASDLRKWNPEKYKDAELVLNTKITGLIKHRFESNLVVSLNYKTDVVVPYSAASLKPTQQAGSTIELVLTSLKPLQGRLSTEPLRRRRSLSLSEIANGPAPPKRRRHDSFTERPGEPAAAPTIGEMLERYADFLPPLSPEVDEKSMQIEDDAGDVDHGEEKGANMDRTTTVAASSLLTSLENESRLVEVAQATTTSGATPRISSVEEFEVAVRNAPQNARLWTLYAAHHHAAGEVERARTVLQRALDSPAATTVKNFIGSILLAFLRLEGSVVVSTRGVGVGVGASVASEDKSSGDLVRLESIIARIEQLDREAVTRTAVDFLSESCLHNHAENMAKKFTRQHALLPEAWLTLIRARFRSGHVAGAREAQRNAAQTLRLSQLLQFAIGCAWLEFKFGDVDRAIKLLEEQLAAHPQKKIIYVNFINLLLSAGKTSEAESARQIALEKLHSKDHAAIKNLF